MLKKVIYYIRLFFSYLFYGFKSADNILTISQKDSNVYDININETNSGGVFKDILEEKVTQEVEELRYSSYKVAVESKKYKYIGNGNVIKKNDSQLSEKHGLIDESDNLKVVLIHDNELICEDVLSVLNEVNSSNNKKTQNDFKIKIKRNLTPRFKIEQYIKKLVLKESDGNYVIDLYCSKYPKQFSEKKDRAFLSEIIRLKTKEIRNSDILDFEELSFITSNTWGVDDWYKFTFIDFELYDIIEFDGNYIFRLGCIDKEFMVNILDKIFSKSAEEKYSKKSSKSNAIFDMNGMMNLNEDDLNIDNIDLESLEKVTFSIENNFNK